MVRSLSLPGSYHQKITHLGRSLLSFSNLKHLDLSRNALESLEVCTCISHSYFPYMVIYGTCSLCSYYPYMVIGTGSLTVS